MDSKSGNKQEPIDARAIELKPIAVSACMPRFIVMNYALLLLPSTWPIQPTICIRARNLPGHSRWPKMLASCLWSVEATIYIIPLLWNIFPCVCVCVCVTERTRRRERENERVQPEIAIHTNKLPRKKRPACPPPSLRHCCPPFVHPFVCVHWMHLVRFICFYYHFRPSLHSFFFLILWGLLRDGNPGSKMRW